MQYDNWSDSSEQVPPGNCSLSTEAPVEDSTYKGPMITCTTNPLNADHDGDTLKDGDEVRLGLIPTVNDRGWTLDEDGDGLSFFEEQAGWTVSFVNVNGQMITCESDPSRDSAPTGDCAHDSDTGDFHNWSNPDLKDSDGDGLSDSAEREYGTHPKMADTDKDGISDYLETQNTDVSTRTDPLDADSDNDLLSDGFELYEGWEVSIYGETPYRVYSNPTAKNSDIDSLTDYQEYIASTDPLEFDTDGDSKSDSVEVSKSYFDPLRQEKVVNIEWVSMNGLYADGEGELDPAGKVKIRRNTTTVGAEHKEGVFDDRPDNSTININYTWSKMVFYEGDTIFIDMYDFYDEDTNEDDNFGDESLEIPYSSISAGSQSRAMSGDGNRLTNNFYIYMVTE